MKNYNGGKGYYISQIVKASFMLCLGLPMLITGFAVGSGLSVGLFALLWCGLLGWVIARNVIDLVKSKNDTLEDTNQYYTRNNTQDYVPSGERQGMMTTCPYCGNQVPEVFDYCNACGQKQSCSRDYKDTQRGNST